MLSVTVVGKGNTGGMRWHPYGESGSWDPGGVLVSSPHSDGRKAGLTSSRKKYGSSISRKGSRRKLSMNSCT